ncbi:Zinc finger, RING/FYVE/PHD-type domain containing protein [Cryptosporidium tyzzeri]|nr:Zinc finger, RING/FYVE/PHD-type domain containing protein [Cryptosporidium tyzzeri]
MSWSPGPIERGEIRENSPENIESRKLMKETEICEECMNLDEFHKVCCTLCGRVKCSNCNISNTVEYKIYDKLICEECISKLYLETNNILQEELDVKDQINLNLKKGLEEQFQIISKCKQFIIALEEIISFQGLWKSICEIEGTENIQNLLFESQGNWNPKMESEKQTIGSGELKFKISNKSTDIANETSTLVEKFRLENDGLRVRCFRLEQRVKELTNNYEAESYQLNSPENQRGAGRIRTISLGLQDDYIPHSILENSAIIFDNHQLVNCVERFILNLKNLFCC